MLDGPYPAKECGELHVRTVWTGVVGTIRPHRSDVPCLAPGGAYRHPRTPSIYEEWRKGSLALPIL